MIYRSLGPDLSSMAMDDALNGSQSYSIAFKLLSKMQTLKHAEQLVCILHVKAGAVVSHEHLYFIPISVHAADLDFGPSSQAREFDRIGNKVDNNQLQHGTSRRDRPEARRPSRQSPDRSSPA